jgi:release factor glutamine methyltransferase
MAGRPGARTVYPFREDSALLLPFAEGAAGLRVLELGCGEGRAALAAARAGARVVATDLNPAALAAVQAAARQSGLAVGAVRTDLFAGLRRFDRVLANPPYLPTPRAARDPDPWANLALDGGSDGLQVTARLVAGLPDHLTERGRGYLLVSSRQDPDAVERLWESVRRGGGSVRAVASRELGGERLTVVELGWGAPRP